MAAIKVFAREGFNDTKVQIIANEAGVSNGTIYNYFTSKQEILDYVYKTEMDKKTAYLDKLAKSKESAIEKIELFIRFYFSEWENNLDVLKIMVKESIYSSSYSPASRNLFKTFVQKIVGLMKEGVDSGELKEMDYEAFCYIMINVLKIALYEFNGLGNYTSVPDVSGTEVYELKKSQLISFVIDGIKK